MAWTYQQVKNKIVSALVGRPAGTRVQVNDHQAAEIAILDYIQQYVSRIGSSIIRNGHATTTPKAHTDLFWNVEFEDTNYDFTVSAFDSRGMPVDVYLVEVLADKIVIYTLTNALVTAIGVPQST